MTRLRSKKSATAFRPGTSKACEALLYEFSGHCGAETPVGTNGREHRCRQHGGTPLD